jgi:hypothetical protein
MLSFICFERTIKHSSLLLDDIYKRMLCDFNVDLIRSSSGDTVEKLDNLMRTLIREDASLADILHLPMIIDKYELKV